MGWTCGECAFCRSGRENLCRAARFTGRDRDGGYAERLVADARWVFPLPDGFSPREAAPLLCAGVIGYRALRLSGIRPGGRLGLFGFGASAHLAIQVARHWGCEVYAFTREPERRELARRLGAVWAGGIEDDPGTALDAAATFAPSGPVAVAALARVERGGTVAVNAIHASPLPSFPYETLYGERSLTSVMNSTREDAAGFLSLAARIPVRAEIETFPLEEANRALQAVKSGTLRAAAVLLPGDGPS
jgi:propanol-preferring alcohol dehydrogenase